MDDDKSYWHSRSCEKGEAMERTIIDKERT